MSTCALRVLHALSPLEVQVLLSTAMAKEGFHGRTRTLPLPPRSAADQPGDKPLTNEGFLSEELSLA